MKKLFGNFKITIFLKLILHFIFLIVVILLLVNIMATRVVNREAEKLFISSTNQSLCQNRNYVESVIKSANNYVNQLTIDSEFCDLLFKNFTDFPTYYENLESAQKRLDTIVLSDNMIDSINIIIPSGISLRSSSLHARTINISEDIVKRVIEQDFYKDAIKFYDKIT